MPATDRIRSFDDVERVQQRNEQRFTNVRDEIDDLAGRMFGAVAEISNRADSNLEDVRQTLREISEHWKESEKKRQEEADRRQKEADRRQKEEDRRQKAADKRQKAAEKRQKETERQQKETERQHEAMIKKSYALMDKGSERHDREMAAISKQNDRIAKMLGDMGNTRGEFVEHMALPSIKRIVEEELKADFLGGFRGGTKGRQVQIDAWATSDLDNAVYVFEIKHKFREEAIGQIFRQIERLRELLPDYASSAIYPFIAVGVISEDDELKVWDAGVHLLKFGDGAFRLCEAPTGFKPAHSRGMKGHARMVPPYPDYLSRRSSFAGRRASTH